ncbi:MAG: translation initiation factor IF-3 [Clostridia bacterium]|nr:translation initiation factor IF-3 [Clostridia bacterium]
MVIFTIAFELCLERIFLIRLFFLRRCRAISKENLINEEIRDKELRVIDSDGTQLGIMSLEAALELANEKKLDLVNIAPNAKPPVCKILDYGKYRYELQKREKEAKKKQKTMQVKEIRLSTFIEEHDITVKANTAIKFLKEGDKVKVSLRFRGRERDYANKGLDVMKTFAQVVAEVGTVEKKPEFEGRSLIMVVAPKLDKDK